jgi:TatD DNase family protein
MVDAHCHLQDLENPSEELMRASQVGVSLLICPGAGMVSSKKAVILAKQYSEVWAAVGLGYGSRYSNLNSISKKLLEMAKNKKVVGIGECGLDWWEGMDENAKLKQQDLFKMHIAVAQQLDLPIIVHCREAFEDVYNLVKDTDLKGQLHCFTGNTYWMEKFVNLGWYISFGGILTFKKSEALRDVLKVTPNNKLLIETDSPYLSPEPIRSKKNSPANVKIIAETVARIKNVSVEEVGLLSTTNLKNLFDKIIYDP